MPENPSWMAKIEAITSAIATQQGCVLYDVEFAGVGNKGRTLRVFIDKHDGNVSIDDCSNVSKALDVALDENDLVPGEAYNLEVSTPGLERHLKQPWHFQKAVGKKIYVKTSQTLESVGVLDKKWKASKTVEEVLTSADDAGIRFVVGGVEIVVPYAMIDKAKMIFDMNKGLKK